MGGECPASGKGTLRWGKRRQKTFGIDLGARCQTAVATFPAGGLAVLLGPTRR